MKRSGSRYQVKMSNEPPDWRNEIDLSSLEAHLQRLQESAHRQPWEHLEAQILGDQSTSSTRKLGAKRENQATLRRRGHHGQIGAEENVSAGDKVVEKDDEEEDGDDDEFEDADSDTVVPAARP